MTQEEAASTGGAPLAGLTVVECGQFGTSAYAGRVLGALGATVWKVEPPEGDWARRRGPWVEANGTTSSALFAYLNEGKRSVRIDLDAAGGAGRLDDLLRGAAILLSSLPLAQAEAAGLTPQAIRARHPALVQAWISPFGLDGERAGWSASNLGYASSGGWASVMPGFNPMREDVPPHQLYGRIGEYYVGLHAAFAALGALGLDGTSRGDIIDVSAQACIAASLNLGLVLCTYAGWIASRLAGSGSLGGTIPCKDGFVGITVPSDRMWETLREMMGSPDWATAPAMDDIAFRNSQRDVILGLIELWAADRTMDEILAASDAARLPFAAVNTVRQAVESAQLRARGFLVEMEVDGKAVRVPGAPITSTSPLWAAPRPAPTLGEGDTDAAAQASAPPIRAAADAAPARPLAGIRVIDFTHAVAGPYCTMVLAALGAEVIKVESSARPEVLRVNPPYADGIVGVNRSGAANQYSQGKRSFTVDLKTAAGIDLVKQFVAKSDIVVENFSTGTMERLGLDYPVLSAINPGLIMVSISGYGSTGPQKARPAFGFGPLTASGIALASGMPGVRPVDDGGVAVADPLAAMHSATAVLAALRRRKGTGQGLLIATSQMESLMAVMPEALLPYLVDGENPERRGNRDDLRAPHGVYRAAGDDKWISIVCEQDEDWSRAAEILGIENDERFRTAATRKANEDELDARIAARTSAMERWELASRMQAAGVAAVPVLDIQEVAGDAALEARGFFVELPHPETGPRRHAGMPWRFDRSVVEVPCAAPIVGEANAYVAEEILGLTAAERERLEATRVLW